MFGERYTPMGQPRRTTRREINCHHREGCQILGEYGIPYYLKVDIEGADLLCLEGLTWFTSRLTYISIESNMN